MQLPDFHANCGLRRIVMHLRWRRNVRIYHKEERFIRLKVEWCVKDERSFDTCEICNRWVFRRFRKVYFKS